MPSSSVDLPVPFSPTMMVIALVETQFEIVAQERQAERIGLAIGDRVGLEPERLRYGAGRLIVRLRREAMCADPMENKAF